MMGLRYYSTYNDVNNEEVTINIYKDGYEGEAESILLSADPITISYESDDVFKPVKYSGCSINLLTPHILQDLYTGKVLDIYIEILKGDSIIWCGYNTPNIYNLEWLTDLDATSIEGIDTLSALLYFDFEYSDYGKDSPTSLYGLISACLKISRGSIYKLKYKGLLDDNNPNLLRELSCLERNFFDEDSEPMKCNAVLEHIMQFLGVTLYQWKDTYYIIDSQALLKDEVSTTTYYLNNHSYTEGTDNLNPKDYIVAENNSSVSFGDVYNLINVIGNLIEIDETTIELDDKGLEPVGNANGKYKMDLYGIIKDSSGKKQYDSSQRLFYQYFNKPDWNIHLEYSGIRANPKEWYYLPLGFDLKGGLMVREASVEPLFTMTSSGTNPADSTHFEPRFKTVSKLNFETYYSFKIGDTYPVCYNDSFNGLIKHYPNYLINDMTGNVVLSHTTENSVSYPNGGFFLLNFDFDLSKELGRRTAFYSHIEPVFSKGSDTSYVMEQHKPKYKINPANLCTDEGEDYGLAYYFFAFKAQLKIGGKYWNGSTWLDTECDFAFRTENKDKYNWIFEGERGDDDWTTGWTVKNTNDIQVHSKNNNSGWLIPITTDLSGTMSFKLYDCILRPQLNSEVHNVATNLDTTTDESEYNYVNLKTLKIEYTPYDETDIYQFEDTDDEDKDLKYSQDIDNNNVVKYDDIVLYLNTYNKELCNKLSYSYVFDKDGLYLKQLPKEGVYLRPEEHIVLAYTSHYGTPKIQHTNIIKDTVEPMDLVWVNSIGKYLMVGSVVYNPTYNNAEVNLYEL